MRAQRISVQQLLAGSRGRLGLGEVIHARGHANRLRHVRVQQGVVGAYGRPLRPGEILVVHPDRTIERIGKDMDALRRFLDAVRTAKIPCIFICASERIPDGLRDIGEQAEISLAASSLGAFLLKSRLTGLLREKIYDHIRVHGVLLEMFGIGVLISGNSGVGKTTAGMMLAQRGHVWIADDAVEIRNTRNQGIQACANLLTRDLVDLKESGVRNIRHLFPGRSPKGTRLRLVLDMQTGNIVRHSESIGGFRDMLGTPIPSISIPSVRDRDFDVLEIEKQVRALAEGGGAS
jgi:HPr kinase/phosphorylase